MMLFAYGTLQDPEVLGAVLGRTVDLAALLPATAPGYLTVHYPGQVYPALVISPGSAAPGRVIADLDASDLALLDAFEGTEYSRTTIGITCRGSAMPAYAYLPTITIPPGGRAWRLDEWTLQHKPQVLGGEIASAQALRSRLLYDQPR